MCIRVRIYACAASRRLQRRKHKTDLHGCTARFTIWKLVVQQGAFKVSFQSVGRFLFFSAVKLKIKIKKSPPCHHWTKLRHHD